MVALRRSGRRARARAEPPPAASPLTPAAYGTLNLNPGGVPFTDFITVTCKQCSNFHYPYLPNDIYPGDACGVMGSKNFYLTDDLMGPTYDMFVGSFGIGNAVGRTPASPRPT